MAPDFARALYFTVAYSSFGFLNRDVFPDPPTMELRGDFRCGACSCVSSFVRLLVLRDCGRTVNARIGSARQYFPGVLLFWKFMMG